MPDIQLRDRSTVENLKRKLTAILIADVAGYSRLTGEDEEGTHTRLVALFRDVLEPAITRHGGVLLKRTGDGLLAEFTSAVEAVRCAIAIQRRVAEQNASLPSARQLAFRIGINVGDVIDTADDIYGDGVNIAARVESLSDPGGIVVSRSVRDQVRDRLDLKFDDLGEHTLKNIARPVRAFRIVTADASPQRQAKRARHRLFGGVRLAMLCGVGAALLTAVSIWWLYRSRSRCSKRHCSMELPAFKLPRRRQVGYQSSCFRSPISAAMRSRIISSTASARA